MEVKQQTQPKEIKATPPKAAPIPLADRRRMDQAQEAVKPQPELIRDWASI
ncbi:hypothetical protein AIOL_002404 [Candidatus Rhodobacter oscarellae]|uniref:Uncharacterized protein n=1 Tax=Candidatus Rhodobacter oscarellae TaxID=1675527 RepID=A0A0J9E3S7_9RHOB|nr:hypothetical protein [Candidatus Rhodobacter lobularis]KMW57440.1 hypothetical protein AIOL_002404 [Candidatus Rhodobacter lobularis]